MSISDFLRAGDSVLVIHAHPDDEVFATGATIATLVEQGHRVVLRLASAGEAAEQSSDLLITVVQARARRVARLTRACAQLGIADWGWLADPGRWVDTGSRVRAGSLTTASTAELAEEISKQVANIKPSLVLTIGSDGLTGHPDHIAINQAVRQAVQAVPVLGARLPTADILRGQQLLAEVFSEPVGSGRVTGCQEHALVTFTGSATSAIARQTALDCYSPGLGTASLTSLLDTYPGRGDSLFLRGVLEATGWRTERYERYS